MEIRFLGTGTSTGVPQIGCDCRVCRSSDPKDKRLRCSAMVKVRGLNLLIDCGPDFRAQMLRAGSPDLDALLLTHSHYDHVGGIDDLRPYCIDRPFDIYGQSNVLADLENRLPYCFRRHPYPGIPSFNLHPVGEREFYVRDQRIDPLPVMHYKLPILGYRIGSVAYLTDTNGIPEATMLRLRGTRVLIINTLRFEPHISHFCLKQTLEVIGRVAPERAYLIHMSHGIGLHEETQDLLPQNVQLAWDDLTVRVDD